MYVDKQVEREYIMREACRLDNLFVSKRPPQNQHNINIDKNVWRPNGIHLPMIFRPFFSTFSNLQFQTFAENLWTAR